MIMDAGLVPLYIYVALADKSNVNEPMGTEGRWGSLIKMPQATEAFLSATWLVAIVVAGLHLLALCNAFYLVRMFRKVANMPPDMNPLEDNLTSRRQSRINKHKHKNSELTLSEKHDSAISLGGFSGRISPEKEPSLCETPVPFFQTRNDSGQLYSPHSPATAEASRLIHSSQGLPSIYSQPASEAASRVDLYASRPTSSREGHPFPQADSKSQYEPASPSNPRAETGLSHQPSVAASSVYTDKSGDSGESAPYLPRKSSKRDSGSYTETGNWYAIRDGDKGEDGDVNNRHAARSPSPAFSIVEEEPEELINGGTPGRGTPNGYSAIESSPNARAAGMPYPATSRLTLSPSKTPYEPVRQSSQFLDPVMDGDSTASERRYAPTPPPKEKPKTANNGASVNSAHDGFERQPLHMNPASRAVLTPPPRMEDAARTSSTLSERGREAGINNTPDLLKIDKPSPGGRPLRNVSGNVRKSSNGSGNGKTTKDTASLSGQSGVGSDRSGSPTRGKHYGDLSSAMNAIRHTPPQSPSRPPTHEAVPTPSPKDKKEPGLGVREWLNSSLWGSGHVTNNSNTVKTSPRTADPASPTSPVSRGKGSTYYGKSSGAERVGRMPKRGALVAEYVRNDQSPAPSPPTIKTVEGDKKGRVVSNSGADLGEVAHLGVGEEYVWDGRGYDRRVSGKVAEEGRGGIMGGVWAGARRRVSGRDG